MFEAYKIATTLELRDMVSSSLLRLSEQLIKLDEKVMVLNKTFRELGENRAFKHLSESSRLATEGIRSASRAAASLERHLARVAELGDAGMSKMAGVGTRTVLAASGRRTGGYPDIYGMPSASGYFMGAGAVGGSVLFMVDKAAQFQKMMIGVKVATHASNQELKQLQNTIEQSVKPTMFSNVDGAKMASIMGQSGLNASQVNNLLPVFTRLADIQYLTKGSPYEKTTKDLIRLAHTAGHYDTKSLSAYADVLNKASMMVPGDLGELGNALKYSQGMAKGALGISDTDMVMFTAFLNRLGLHGSRGGTNALAALVRTLPGLFGSGLLTGKSGKALHEMGFSDAKGHSTIFRNGHFDLTAWIMQLSRYVATEMAKFPEALARQHIARNFQFAFGVQGARVATLLSQPEALHQLQQMNGRFAQLQTVEQMQNEFAQGSAWQQWQTAKTDFVTAMTNLGQTILPGTTANLKKLNSELDKLNDWIKNNKTEAHMLVEALMGLAAAMALAGTITVLSKTFRTLAWALGFRSAGGAAGIEATATAVGKQAWSIKLLAGAFDLLTSPVGALLTVLAGAGFATKKAVDAYHDWNKDSQATEKGAAARHSAREALNRQLAAVGQPPLGQYEDTANGQKRLELATKGRAAPAFSVNRNAGFGWLKGGSVPGWIHDAARKSGIPASLLAAMIHTESAFNAGAHSRKGALGIAQWMPGTAAEWGVNPLDPKSSIYGAARYLAYYHAKFHSWRKALQAYNAGPGAAMSGRANHFHETRAYVRKIMKEAGIIGTGGNEKVSFTVPVYLDGRKITEVVTHHQARAMNRPQTGISGFDRTLGYSPATI